MSDTESPVVPLHDEHERLSELFLCHQEQLIGLDLPGARATLEAWISGIRRHIAWEDSRLFPSYAEHVLEPPRGGAPKMFFDEHRKIERLVGEIEHRLEQLLADAGHPLVRRGVLKLIERELTLVHVLEHHHLREEEILVPELACHMTEDALRTLLAEVDEAP